MGVSRRLLHLPAAIAAVLFLATGAHAQTAWWFDQIYSNADGSIQFLVVSDKTGTSNNQDALSGIQLQSIHNSAEHAHDPGFVSSFVLPNNLPSSQTAGKQFLIATQSFAYLNIITPDYVIADQTTGQSDQFIPQINGYLALIKGQSVIDTAGGYTLPTDGVTALSRQNGPQLNRATNFAGQSVSVPLTPPAGAIGTAVEYYHAEWDYYFETSFPDEQAILDGGAFGGVWKRTGQTFKVWTQGSATTPAACRFFSTSFAPKSSHFYTPFWGECASVKTSPNWQFEAVAFYLGLADAGGNCGGGTAPLYRAYNNGMGGAPNHRYTTSLAVLDQMIAAGWVFEGNGNTKVFACVPA